MIQCKLISCYVRITQKIEHEVCKKSQPESVYEKRGEGCRWDQEKFGFGKKQTSGYITYGTRAIYRAIDRADAKSADA